MRNLVLVNIKLIIRDRQTLFWALAFPLIMVLAFGLVDDRGFIDQLLVNGEAPYFDVVLIGLVGWGVMFNLLIGIAVKLSAYREQMILRRFLATPLRIWRFFVALFFAHILLAVVQTCALLVAGVLIFGADIHGNILWIFVLVICSCPIFLNIGVILSAIAKTPAAASGIGNAVVFPMMFFSGVFFPVESFPRILSDLTVISPLKALLDPLRQVGIHGGVPWDLPWSLALLGVWLIGSSLLALRTFKFR